jgi:hypothetical protein
LFGPAQSVHINLAFGVWETRVLALLTRFLARFYICTYSFNISKGLVSQNIKLQHLRSLPKDKMKQILKYIILNQCAKAMKVLSAMCNISYHKDHRKFRLNLLVQQTYP